MIDRLLDKIDQSAAPIVVGLDPVYGMIPERIRRACTETHGNTLRAAAAMLTAFNREIIDSVCDLVPAVKPQNAMYEQFGPEGVRAYAETAAYAAEKGLIVIGDVKRGDIASTAAAYAAHIGGVELAGERFDPWREDAVTLNPYMGSDGITPFLDCCRAHDKGVFILVRTSNPSSSELQEMRLAESGLALYEHVADLVSGWGADLMGRRGYSRVGAVVGATCAEQGRALRKRMPHSFFLVPGYGAQGASGQDLKGFFDKDGRGCIVNSSRGIIAAWQKDARFGEADLGAAAREAVLAMRADLREVLGG
ncbi:MAG: orotidine-5'-phosphate decarboxylase [Clostridiales Family XIII bacterium]|jgi:orotidine-5'-phosphate decarboxylase|nr:orotidine-5'-phosphate decarboxylase [Clostridiales Family XIII bacterium]